MVRQQLARVEAEVGLCDRCFGCEPRFPVRFARPAGPGRVLVMGEAAARPVLEEGSRLGLENPDPATRFLRELVREAALPEEEVLVAAAILCRAKDRGLEEAVPRATRVNSCADHVRELVTSVRPRLLLPLGATALRSLRRGLAHEPAIRALRFPDSVGRTGLWGGTYVHPLYHPSLRARVTRPEDAQRSDWREVGKLWAWIAAGEPGPMPRAGFPVPAR